MKRAFSIITLLIAMIFVFTACSTTPTPSIVDRWADGETATFKISLADETNVKDFENEVPKYNKVPGAQVKPSKVDGQLTYQVNKVDGQWQFFVSMLVAETYAKTDLPSDWQSTLADANITAQEDGSNVIISSAMASYSVFGTVYNESVPVSSYKFVQGAMVFYNEETQPSLAINNFETETTYADGKATTKFEDHTGTVTNKQSQTTVELEEGLVFDNESFLLAIRSVDMAMLAEASTISLSFFNSVEQTSQGVIVAISSDEYKLDDNSDELTYRIGVSLDTVSAYSYYMYFEQSKTIGHPSGSIGKPVVKQELVEMNSGYMHFERV